MSELAKKRKHPEKTQRTTIYLKPKEYQISKCQLKGAQLLQLACQRGGSHPFPSVSYATGCMSQTFIWWRCSQKVDTKQFYFDFAIATAYRISQVCVKKKVPKTCHALKVELKENYLPVPNEKKWRSTAQKI